jgi:hypothetical protein
MRRQPVRGKEMETTRRTFPVRPARVIQFDVPRTEDLRFPCAERIRRGVAAEPNKTATLDRPGPDEDRTALLSRFAPQKLTIGNSDFTTIVGTKNRAALVFGDAVLKKTACNLHS